MAFQNNVLFVQQLDLIQNILCQDKFSHISEILTAMYTCALNVKISVKIIQVNKFVKPK